MFSVSKLDSKVGAFLRNLTIEPNATIRFDQLINSPNFITDEIGNIVPSEPSVVTVELQCYLVQKKLPIADVQAGTNLDSEYFQGRLTSPKNYTFPLPSNGKISAIINNRQGLVTQLILLESPVSSQLNLGEQLGQKISCYIQFSQGN